MKLKLAEREQSNKFPYCKLLLLVFCSLYLLIPYIFQLFVESDFYIYSQYQSNAIIPTVYFCLFLFVFLYYVAYDLKWHFSITSRKLTKRSYHILIYLTIIYLFIIILRDLPLKLSGASRIDMLKAISSQLLPGFGILLLFCMISVLELKRIYYLILFCAVCLLIDLVHEGKIFTTYAFLCAMFYFDVYKFKISIQRLLLIGFIGLSFLILIFFMRANAVGENPVMGIHSMFSEFMGVNATTGWAIEYALRDLPYNFTDFDSTLRSYYINDVGHGLALSPVAYFIGNFADCFSIAVPIYFIITTIVFIIGNRLIGKYSYLILLYNFIHLLRHGPNLFLTKSIIQIIIVTLYFVWIYNHKKYNLI